MGPWASSANGSCFGVHVGVPVYFEGASFVVVLQENSPFWGVPKTKTPA